MLKFLRPPNLVTWGRDPHFEKPCSVCTYMTPGHAHNMCPILQCYCTSCLPCRCILHCCKESSLHKQSLHMLCTCTNHYSKSKKNSVHRAKLFFRLILISFFKLNMHISLYFDKQKVRSWECSLNFGIMYIMFAGLEVACLSITILCDYCLHDNTGVPLPLSFRDYVKVTCEMCRFSCIHYIPLPQC